MAKLSVWATGWCWPIDCLPKSSASLSTPFSLTDFFCNQTFSVKERLPGCIRRHKLLILLRANILLQAGTEMKTSSNTCTEFNH